LLDIDREFGHGRESSRAGSALTPALSRCGGRGG
jgi:hypothetical protein